MDEAAPNMTDAGWVSISELARLKGLGKAAVSERVSGFVAKGLLSTKPGKGKVKLVNLAAFDRVAGETTDLARAAGAETKRLNLAPAAPAQLPADPLAPVYTAEQARHMAYKAESAKLDLEERQGKILQAAAVAAAITMAGEAIARAVDQMPALADDLAAAVAQTGAAGARTLLKARARDIRELMARELAAVLNLTPPEAAAEPETDPDA
jgi:phage terminase Nu1 subunit (DNA packaging protein)